MAESLDVFTGILLTVIGLVLVYGSIVYRLIDLVLILGVLITIFGLYKLLPAFIYRILDLQSPKKGSNTKKRLNESKNDTLSMVKEGAKEVENLVNTKLDNTSNPKAKLTTHDSYYEDSSLDEPTATLDDFLSATKPKEPAPKFETPIDESKQVLRTKPVKEEKPKFKLPSIRKSNKPKKRSYGYLKDDQKESSPDTFYFTPNYEKPMKVTRRPRKRSVERIDLRETPKRSQEISKALASVGEAETIYDNEVTDDSYSLIPKTIDEEIILPINEIDIDEIVEEPIYDLSQSENTLYNNVIYDDSGADDVITPIYADEAYKEEHGIGDVIYPEYEDETAAVEDRLDYITPEAEIDVEELPRPTSIASTNPIASKRDINSYLTRPHRKSEVLSAPKPRPKPKEGAVLQREVPKPTPVTAEPEVAVVEEDIPSPSPIAQTPEPEDDVPSISELLDGDDETIHIDPNDPESLPIPRLLNSYVICDKGILTSQEAFEEVASHSKEEILLEAPSVKDMGDRFLSSLSKIKSRVIIEEVDLDDLSYVLLLSSLIKKGVEIKTLPSVNSFNLIGDTSHALIISNSVDENDFEYGAVYDDVESVENIKELFESSWAMAKDLDINAIIGDE